MNSKQNYLWHWCQFAYAVLLFLGNSGLLYPPKFYPHYKVFSSAMFACLGHAFFIYKKVALCAKCFYGAQFFYLSLCFSSSPEPTCLRSCKTFLTLELQNFSPKYFVDHLWDNWKTHWFKLKFLNLFIFSWIIRFLPELLLVCFWNNLCRRADLSQKKRLGLWL
jgi:hypothetical protein